MAMYEFKGGTRRLARALQDASENDIERLAQLLHYVPSQLEEDIDALNDFFDAFKARARETNDRATAQALAESE